MQPDVTETERRNAHRIPAADHPTGHDLLAIDVPGTHPTEYAIDLTTGPTYGARYWRCRACGEERNRPDDFDDPCPGWGSELLATDGGHSIEDARTDRALAADRSVEWVRFGPDYRVEVADGSRYTVNVEAETCTCDDHPETGGDCEHLRRVDLVVRTGELPGPDGRFAR